ncbi:MAG: acyl carrier protein [Chloroflexota bacterium]|nr:acyl carrier protein [Chloroflexota bacterium]MDE2898616.1 acyl carrier protein [Chloroflexota bacterium]
MASTEDRLRTLVAENLEVDGQPVNVPADLNVSLTDAGVPSMDFVAFAKVIVREFDVPLTPDECADFSTLKDLAAYINSQAA